MSYGKRQASHLPARIFLQVDVFSVCAHRLLDLVEHSLPSHRDFVGIVVGKLPQSTAETAYTRGHPPTTINIRIAARDIRSGNLLQMHVLGLSLIHI